MSLRPSPPFDVWPVQEVDPGFGFSWYVDPGVLVTQSLLERGDLAATEFILSMIEEVHRARSDEITAAGGLFVFHDWRTMKQIDRDARQLYADRVKTRPPGFTRGAVVVVGRGVSALLTMAIQTVNMVMSFASGGTGIRIYTDPLKALSDYGIRTRPPRPFPIQIRSRQRGSRPPRASEH